MQVSENKNKPVVENQISETYADIVSAVFFDGNVVKLELCVKRYRFVSDNDLNTTVHPVCRLVLSKDTFKELSRVIQDQLKEIEARA
jgi:hypothetical protein